MINETISHYKVVRKIGGGGMGVVYEAEDLELDRHVALKFLPEDLAEHPEALERFRREARAASALNHPHICTIHEIGEHQGQPFLILELLKGETLSQRLARGRLPVDEVIRFGGQLADALDAAHSAGIVHRDIKPANMFVTERGDLKVLDFGLAKRATAEGEMDFDTSAPTMGGTDGPLTTPGTTLGTVHYMSPEQVRAETLDARTDIFSAGVVLYEMAAGQLPFNGSSAGVVFSEILNAQPPAPGSVNPDVGANLEAVIARTLAKERQDRYQTAAELMRDLRALATGERQPLSRSAPAEAPTEVFQSEVVAATGPASPTTHSRFLWAALVVVALVAIGAAWLAFRAGRTEAPQDVAAAEPARKVLVLPFENLGPADDNYFAQGLADEVSSLLGSLGGVAVISRTTARRYAETEKSPQEIGEELDATHLVAGSVRWSRDGETSRVRILPELMLIGDAIQLWSATIDRDFADVLSIQGEIASQIAAGLGIELDETERRALETELTASPAAYDAYLRGGQARRDRDYSGAVEQYERAVELDPSFAEAWAQLARNRATTVRFGQTDDPEAAEWVRSEAERAVTLKPESTLAQLALGYYYYDVRADFARAAEIFELVAERRPEDFEIANALAAAYRRLGRVQESIDWFTRSVELDPDQPNILGGLAVTLGALRRWDEAEDRVRQAIEVAPDKPLSHSILSQLIVARGGSVDDAKSALAAAPRANPQTLLWLEWCDRDYEAVLETLQQGEAPDPYVQLKAGMARRRMGDEEGAKAHFEKGLELTSAAGVAELEVTNEQEAAFKMLYSWLQAALGNTDEATRAADESTSLRRHDAFVLPRNVAGGAARAYAWAGESERALDLLEEGLLGPAGLGEGWIWGLSGSGLRCDPDWDDLRVNPRFAALLEEIETPL